MKPVSGKRRLFAVMVGIVSAALARAEGEDIEISGASVSAGSVEVMLIQKSTGAGRWVKIGQSFAGYTVKDYDDKTGRLTVTKGPATSVLTLKKSTVQTAGEFPSAPATPEQQKAVMNNLRQLSAAADQYFLEQGVSKVTVAQLVGTEPGKYIKAIKPAAGESYPGTMVIEQGQPIRVKTGGGQEMQYQN